MLTIFPIINKEQLVNNFFKNPNQPVKNVFLWGARVCLAVGYSNDWLEHIQFH